MTEVSEWFDDLVLLGTNEQVLNKPHGRAGMDVEAGTALVYEAGSRLARYYLNHGFLTPAPGVSSDSFECAFEHAIGGHYGGQWWSYQGWFYPPDHGYPADTPPTCFPVDTLDVSMEVQSRTAGFGLVNTADSGDYLQGNTNSFGLGFRLKAWLDTYGPDAGWGVPEPPPGAEIEWEYDTPDFQGLDAAGDEDWTVPQPGIPGAIVRWRTPGGLSAVRQDYTGAWYFHTGERPSGDILATNTGGTPPWNNITPYVDSAWIFRQSEAPINPGAGDVDLVATCASGLDTFQTCAKPGSLNVYRDGQWLAIRVRMRARRYRWIFNNPPATRQYPRDTLGLAAAERVYPPSRTARVVGGHL